MRHALFLLTVGAVVLALGPTGAKAAADDQEVRLLRAENTLLKATLKRREDEIAVLKDEIKALKAGNAKLRSPHTPGLKYNVVDLDTYDAPIKTQIRMDAVVSGNITESGLKELLKKLYAKAQATRGLKYHGGKPTHVFIYLYTSRDHFKSGMGQWIAMLDKVGEGAKVKTSVKKELIQQLDEKLQVKHGLPESKRKEIFRMIVKAEDRADDESQRLYPLPAPSSPGYSRAKAKAQLMKQGEADKKLAKKYKAEIAKRYGITRKQLTEITAEGARKNWPMP